ncbi:hypothetical protein GpartN1_g2136.t1 [Galdieria partita]|uniref:Uncharacterized protein n=1 Tax=Galdieria partita TaxID=83374 RepID=A0A9C7UPB2_9RHOD|nr:hypothetical protein GpartN1_g2136.t1 [Galdieria partita]
MVWFGMGFLQQPPTLYLISSPTWKTGCFHCEKQTYKFYFRFSPCIRKVYPLKAVRLLVVCQDKSEFSQQDVSPQKESQELSGPQSLSIEEANSLSEKEPYPGYYRDMEQLGLKPQSQKDDGLKVGGAKSLYRADGTPYAPWLIGKVMEDPRPLAPKKKPSALGRLAADPQLQEIAGVGLKAKILGDEVELVWSTDKEENNIGFIVQRRRGGTEDFQVIADYKTDPSLKSKGSSGGNYSFIDSTASPGTWIYRISDVNSQGETSDLCQTLVEISSNEDKQRQKWAVIILSSLVIALFVVGLLLDPLTRK